MSAHDYQLAARKVVASVRSAFPDDARSVDGALLDDHFEIEDAPDFWIERFAQRTTDAIKERQSPRAAAHLNLFSSLLETADEDTVCCIDVSYVESLMWDINDDRLKHEGWRLLPGDLRALYTAMWGEKPLHAR